MKKIFGFAIILLCIQSKAQINEGTIKFTMKLEGASQDISAQLLSNTSVTIYFKKDKALMEMNTPAYNMRTLTDNSGLLLLMDAAGQKFYTRKTKEEIARDKAAKRTPDPIITYTQESKKILGYDCKKAYLTIQGNRGIMNKMTVWVTDKIRSIPGIGPVNAEALTKIKGMTLEVDMEQGTVKSKMTATEISMKPLADGIFAVSTNGYVERKAPGAMTPKR